MTSRCRRTGVKKEEFMPGKVWFITGCSSGFGRQIARKVVARGDFAVATVKGAEYVAELAKDLGDNALVLPLDLTEPDTITKAVADAEARFGRIDVLVNNGGYAYFSAVEEGEEDEIRRQFETNVFGLFAVTQQVLPGMRARRSGHIVNFSSIGGLMAFPALAFYHATKFAVEGYSESLSLEVAPLGIRVTIVEPGRFRTEFSGASMVESKTWIDDYADTAGKRRQQLRAVSGTQPGDPAKGAEAIIAAVDAEDPPLRLLLGPEAYQLALGRLDALRQNFVRWKHLTESTDFAQV
jgi:NAD(P)-dependent dehydrogenase (short-subunit alcohol dehydrogenase family)